MTWLVLLLAFAPVDDWKRADALAAQARACRGQEKQHAADKALAAYAVLLRAHGKDAKLHPRLRRRRASVLRDARRVSAALAEHDAIVAGRARRKDRARALFEGARLLVALGRKVDAIERLSRGLQRYPDVSRTRARAACLQGSLLESVGRIKEAVRAYRLVVEKCRFEEKEAIAAFDALALLELRRDRRARARRWVELCFRCYSKRASRGDKKAAFLGRQLAAMKAPVALAEADSPPKGPTQEGPTPKGPVR